jgi:hypothetical protein
MRDDRWREYRRLAAECLALARLNSGSEASATLLSMAQKPDHAERNADSRSLRYRAIQAAIGAELKIMYGLPDSLPPRFLALLGQMNTENEG